MHTKTLRTTKVLKKPAIDLVLSPDNRTIIYNDDDSLKILDFSNLELVSELKPDKTFDRMDIVVTEDGRFVLESGFKDDLVILIWDLLKGELHNTFDRLFPKEDLLSGGFGALTLLQNGKYVIAASEVSTITILDFASGKKLRTMEHKGGVISLIVLPDGKRFISSGFNNTIYVWNFEAGTIIQEMVNPNNYAENLVMVPNEDYFACNTKNSIGLWELNSGTLLFFFKAHDDYITSLITSHTRNQLISSSKDNTIKFWDL